MSEKKECFVISPIGDPKSDTRKKSDLLFNHVIKPVMDEFEYTTDRADKIGEPGIITSQVIQRIEKSPLVIADLTGPNANVFYELAIRHAIRKPLIQLITKGEPIPFDVAGLRTIQYDLTDLDSVEDTKKEIRKQVKAIETGTFKMDTPISTAIDLMKLKESGDPEQQSLAKVTDMLSGLKRDMMHIRVELNRSRQRIPREIVERERYEITREEVLRREYEMRKARALRAKKIEEDEDESELDDTHDPA